jgi:hypothetical protein
MPTPLAAGVDLGDIIRFTPVHIPRFVTRRHLGEVLAGVDFRVGPWYGNQVSAPQSRQHTNPALLLTSQLVVYGVFAFLSIVKLARNKEKFIFLFPWLR